MSQTQALTDSANKLADIIAKAQEHRLHVNNLDALEKFQAMIGAAYIVARHPQLCPIPIPGMIARLDRIHAQFTAELEEAIEGGHQ